MYDNTYFVTYAIIYLIINAILGLIPANIAKNKGYGFGLWWFYGWMLFLIAMIHVLCIPDRNPQQNFYMGMGNGSISNTPSPQTSAQSIADELKKYKELLDQGVLTEEEFALKKEQLLKLM